MNNMIKPEQGKDDLGLKRSTGGVFDDVGMLSEAIRRISSQFNVVNPGGAVGSNLPILHSGGVSFVFVDPDHETYRIPGREEVGLGKTALDRIAAAAGVRWNPHLCGRVDDGHDANFVEYQVLGSVLQLDGTERPITGIKRIDLRADKSTPVETWGADAQEIKRIADLKKDSEGKSRDPWPQILSARQHILSLAESKAKNRAIRSLGVRTSYTKADLAKGFAVVRLQFTGRSDDPEITRMVAEKILDRALSSSSMLYGERPRELQAAPQPARIVRLAPAVEADDDEPEVKKPEPVKAPEKPSTEEKPKEPNPEGEDQPETPKRAEPKDDPLLICGKADEETGKYPRKPCSAFTIDQLKKKREYYEKNRPNWEAKWAAKNQAELDAVIAWIAFYEFDPHQGELHNPDSGSDAVL